jgi:hypothetical protein
MIVIYHFSKILAKSERELKNPALAGSFSEGNNQSQNQTIF